MTRARGTSPGPWKLLRPAWSGDVLAQLLEQLALALGADQPTDRLAIFEDDERGNAHHFEASGGVGVVVDVELGDAHLARLLGRDLLEDRGDHLARTAPLGPEVDDDHIGAGAGDLLVEGGVGQGADALSHRALPLSVRGRVQERTRWVRHSGLVSAGSPASARR